MAVFSKGSRKGLTIRFFNVAVSAVGLFIMAILFVHELRFYLETVTVHEVFKHFFDFVIILPSYLRTGFFNVHYLVLTWNLYETDVGGCQARGKIADSH